jgi:uncharacterized membrane protein YeaQ/YmgE (transglycosylase-associated protein family)
MEVYFVEKKYLGIIGSLVSVAIFVASILYADRFAFSTLTAILGACGFVYFMDIYTEK